MVKLLILDPSYRRNTAQEPLSAIERHDGLFYRIVRRNMGEARGKDVDLIAIAEDLELTTPETKLPNKRPIGNKWRTLPPVSKDPEKIKKLRSQILKTVKSKRCDETFIALNKHYHALLPDLTPYTKKMTTASRGLDSKSKRAERMIG